MGANAFEYNVKLNLNAETKLAKAQIGELQKELQSISQLKINTAGIDKLTDEILPNHESLEQEYMNIVTREVIYD